MVVALYGTPTRAPQCLPSDCLAILSDKVSVASVEVLESALVGNWSKGQRPGLFGSDLYLFRDHTYIYTMWADLMPETIYDRGSWSLTGNLLAFSSDPHISWDPGADRRYMTLRKRGRTETLLFGLDRSLDTFLKLTEGNPDSAEGYFRVSVLRKARTWPREQASRLKNDLMKNSWRPCFFTNTGCP
jgi:hypothetical protein